MGVGICRLLQRILPIPPTLSLLQSKFNILLTCKCLCVEWAEKTRALLSHDLFFLADIDYLLRLLAYRLVRCCCGGKRLFREKKGHRRVLFLLLLLFLFDLLTACVWSLCVRCYFMLSIINISCCLLYVCRVIPETMSMLHGHATYLSCCCCC